jgi:hypothetical protein
LLLLSRRESDSTKYVAKVPQQAEGRPAMKGSMIPRSSAFLAAFVSAAFLWALALSASPQLHARVHPDASQSEHSCAATFVASGSYNHSAHAPLVSAPVPVVQFATIPTLTPQWVESPFLSASIFEHAPPVCA